MKSKKLITICLLATAIIWSLPTSLVFAQALPAQAFSDVPASSKFFIPAEYLKGQNLISGYEDGTFRPDNSVNRAEALAMIFKATGRDAVSPEDENTKNITAENPLQIHFPKSTNFTIQNLKTGEKTEFSKIKDLKIEVETGGAKLKIIKSASAKIFDDVSEKDWFYGVVKEAKHLGIVKGYDGKDFKPANGINLAEVLRMLFQSAGIDTNAETSPVPTNVPADAWFSKDVAYAVNHYMVLQLQNGEIFPPDKKLNRGEMATLLYRFFQSKKNAQFGYASWYADGLAKTKLTVGLEYKEKNLTAAHRDFPFGTILQVTNMNNGKQIEVVVNDRGPFVAGRIIDLSKSAFSALESTSAGVVSVRVEQFKAEK